jgi:PhnB protein
MAVKPVPEGYHTITPYLSVDDASAAIEFYKRAFGAEERGRMPGLEGKIAHAELQIGDSLVMLSDPFPQMQSKNPKEVGTTTVGLFLYVEDVDAAFKRAVEAGATPMSEPTDMFWGDRFGSVADPFGHHWQMATHVEDVPREEMEKRAADAMASMSG